jgi:uncharacterized SAM-dependent methyltransferase
MWFLRGPHGAVRCWRSLVKQVFAKLKPLLRKADPRTTETAWREIGALLGNFSPQQCANYLVNCGYASAEKDRALGGRRQRPVDAFSAFDPKSFSGTGFLAFWST